MRCFYLTALTKMNTGIKLIAFRHLKFNWGVSQGLHPISWMEVGASHQLWRSLIVNSTWLLTETGRKKGRRGLKGRAL